MLFFEGTFYSMHTFHADNTGIIIKKIEENKWEVEIDFYNYEKENYILDYSNGENSFEENKKIIAKIFSVREVNGRYWELNFFGLETFIEYFFRQLVKKELDKEEFQKSIETIFELQKQLSLYQIPKNQRR